MGTKYTTRKEWITYVVMWLVMFLAPLASMYAHATVTDDVDFHWMPVLHLWDGIIVMLLGFVIHNHFLAPLLVYKHDTKKYLAFTLVLCIAFSVYKCTYHPPRKHHHNHHTEMVESKPHEGDMGFKSLNDQRYAFPPELHNGKPDDRHRQRPPLAPQDLMSIMLFIFVLGLKNLFKNMLDNKRKQDEEKEFLQQRLDYLKYQVNPHFLMNTLNNIHALVDIEPESAKTSIVKLSHLLRYVLYDGSKSTIPLDRGIVFLNNYIDLMRMRYQDNVEIVFDYPDPIPNVNVLPLLVISFVEIAFKHGVSYAKPSFIHISIQVKGKELTFTCRNSKHNDNQKKSIEQGGFGIDNVIKRMELMFGNDYTFEVDDNDTSYQVKLTFPLDQIH